MIDWSNNNFVLLFDETCCKGTHRIYILQRGKVRRLIRCSTYIPCRKNFWKWKRNVDNCFLSNINMQVVGFPPKNLCSCTSSFFFFFFSFFLDSMCIIGKNRWAVISNTRMNCQEYYNNLSSKNTLKRQKKAQFRESMAPTFTNE